MTSKADTEYFDELCSNAKKYTSTNRLTSYANLIISRIKRDRSNTPESDYQVEI